MRSITLNLRLEGIPLHSPRLHPLGIGQDPGAIPFQRAVVGLDLGLERVDLRVVDLHLGQHRPHPLGVDRHILLVQLTYQLLPFQFGAVNLDLRLFSLNTVAMHLCIGLIRLQLQADQITARVEQVNLDLHGHFGRLQAKLRELVVLLNHQAFGCDPLSNGKAQVLDCNLLVLDVDVAVQRSTRVLGILSRLGDPPVENAARLAVTA
ncbi:MAG: hypothetical protein BWZ07_03245 [Alphaproteobacteria bacterium ADurb.BinA280]|nr:MAG: hypothetical protein BWZ07_03245 [Alphaproteobacteria bacterium ADurb.BinA280]